jgi:hypothetical protein
MVEQMLFNGDTSLFSVQLSAFFAHPELDVQICDLLVKDTAIERWLNLRVPN